MKEYFMPHISNIFISYAVITGCGDGVIRCYDAKSGYLLRTFGHNDENSHPGAIMALQMSGEKIYSATTDGIVRAFKIDWEFVRYDVRVNDSKHLRVYHCLVLA